MDDASTTVHCAKCGAVIDEPANTKPENRKPCPTCGSTARDSHSSASDKFTPHDSLKFKQKSTTGKTTVEGFSGDDLHKKSGKWMKKERLIDHEKDQYKEIVTDAETGNEVHRCEEPLSKHTGHGSAKKKPGP